MLRTDHLTVPQRLSWMIFNDFMDKNSHALTRGKEIFVEGDLDGNMMKSSPESDALKDLCSSFNLTQLIYNSSNKRNASVTFLD